MSVHVPTPSTVRTAVLAVLVAAGLAVAAGCSGPAAVSGPESQDGPAAQASAPGVQQLAVRTSRPDGGTRSSGTTAGQRVITVTGVGTATGVPDTLTLQLGVQTQADSAAQALRENNSAASAVIDRLRKAGIAEKDLQTSRLSIDPTYAESGSTITGYRVTNSVIATLHDIDRAGAVIDAAQQAAGNAIRLDQVGFSFADDAALRSSARTEAVKQALAQAGQLADAAGVTLGPVVSIGEDSAPPTPRPIYAPAAAADSAAAMPVLPGSADVTVTVQVVVAIG